MHGRLFNMHTNKAEISLSHKHEECDRGMASGVLDQMIHNFTLKVLISAWLFSNHSAFFFFWLSGDHHILVEPCPKHDGRQNQ